MRSKTHNLGDILHERCNLRYDLRSRAPVPQYDHLLILQLYRMIPLCRMEERAFEIFRAWHIAFPRNTECADTRDYDACGERSEDLVR